MRLYPQGGKTAQTCFNIKNPLRHKIYHCYRNIFSKKYQFNNSIIFQLQLAFYFCNLAAYKLT